MKKRFLLVLLMLVSFAAIAEEDISGSEVIDSGGFFCSLQVSVFQDRWFDDRRSGQNWCDGFLQFSRFCQISDRDGRFFGRFRHQRNFDHRGSQSFGRSRARVFAGYFDWFNQHRFHQRGFRHSWHFNSGCH